MPKTLLLADDSVTIQKVVGISFANEDIVLLTVDNGDDAIARAREARPDVVLADVVMPGKNGYDVCQAIKADASLAHIPVLLLTGTFEAFDEQRAARVGADGHITKPFEAQSLVDKVNSLLARPAARADAAADEQAARPGGERTGGAPIGALRPARAAAPPPPPQPVSHTADTAYDFFDEEITAPRGNEPVREDTTVLLRSPTPTPTPSPSRPPAPTDDGFQFDEPAPERAPLLPPRAPMADPPGFGSDDLALDLGGPAGDDDSSLFDDFAAPSPAAAPRPASPAPSEPPPSADFAWEPPGEAQPSGDFAASAARSEPSPSEEFGWNARSEPQPSEELGWNARSEAQPSGFPAWEPSGEAPAGDAFAWDAGGEPAEPPQRAAREAPDWFAETPDPNGATRLLATEPADDRSPTDPRGSLGPGAPERLGEFELDAGLDDGAGFGSAVLDPRAARDYDVSSSDLGPPLAAPGPASAATEAPRSGAAQPGAAPSLPAFQQRELHDALEKMAWEAFGPVAETLVRDAVERIERIAWEVIPQMAEALIREEIRKLKGE